MSQRVLEYMNEYNTKYSLIDSVLVGFVFSVIIFFIDIRNSITKLIEPLDRNQFFIIICFILIGVCIVILKYKIHKMIKHPLINQCDRFLMTLTTLFVSTSLISLGNYKNQSRLMSYSFICLIICMFYLYKRMKIITRIRFSEGSQNSLLDLKDIIDGDVDLKQRFLIREVEVEYDLLNNKMLIDDLVYLIENHRSQGKFVIGIEGDWGSGKSTFINNVLKKVRDDEKFIVINDFEPWISEDETALLENLLRKIFENSNLKIADSEIDNVILAMSKLIFGKKYSSLYNSIFSRSDEDKAKKTIQAINTLLRLNNQKIIFVIDNLERTTPPNVHLILNIVHNILNIDNLIVFLLYDLSELEKSLATLSINKGYIDKIVNQKISLPLNNEEDLVNICLTTIRKMADAHDLNFNENILTKFFYLLAENKFTIRNFKRFLNSSILPIIFQNRGLSLTDYFIIEYIKFSRYDIYQLVYTNSEYFISLDKGFDATLSTPKDEKFNSFFLNLEKMSRLHVKLLALIFPTVDEYLNGKGKDYKKISNYGKLTKEYKEFQKDKKIFSSKYFALYFTSLTNDNLEILRNTEVLINQINNKAYGEIDSIVRDIVGKSAEAQYDLFSSIPLYVQKLSDQSSSFFAQCLLKNYNNFKDFDIPFGGSSKDKLVILLVELLDKNDYEKIIHELSLSISNLELLRRLKYWLGSNIEFKDLDIADEINKVLEEMTDGILLNKINLYSDELYYRRNIFIIYWVLEKQGRQEEFKEYMNSIINKRNIFRVLGDMIQESTGNRGYGYEVLSSIDSYVDKKKLETELSGVEALTSDQKFVKQAFIEYFESDSNMEINKFFDQKIKLDNL